MSDLANAIKRIAVDANDASKPDGIMFGKLIATKPLTVQINEKLTLNEKMKSVIVLKSFKKSMVPPIQPPPPAPPIPPYAEVGDTVLVFRTDKGNKFIFIDVIG